MMDGDLVGEFILYLMGTGGVILIMSLFTGLATEWLCEFMKIRDGFDKVCIFFRILTLWIVITFIVMWINGQG